MAQKPGKKDKPIPVKRRDSDDEPNEALAKQLSNASLADSKANGPSSAKPVKQVASSAKHGSEPDTNDNKSSASDTDEKFSFSSFEFGKVLGEGSFARV